METGYRRFNKAYLQLARKNGKSQLLSIIATYEMMVYLEGETAEVYSAATKKDQARIVYDEAVTMLKRAKAFEGRWREAYRRLEHPRTDSFFRPLSQDDRTGADGYNPQCAIIDEYHAHDTTEIYDIMDSGMGARTQPLIVIITTAGFNLNSPCYTIEYKLANAILNPDIDAGLDNVFADIHELEINQSSDAVIVERKIIGEEGNVECREVKIEPGDLIDDPFDENNWHKANPVICSYPEGVDYLRKRAQEAKIAEEKERNFFTKHLNIWINQRDSGYMNMQKWAACGVEAEDLPDLRGQSCYVGVDLSAKIDLTSVAFVFPLGGKYVVLSHSFIPEARFNERLHTDRTYYDVWRRRGRITLIPGEVVDYRHIKAWVIALAEEQGYMIEEWAVDPWSASQLSGDLIDEGYTVVDIRQGPRTLSEPTNAFREECYLGNIIHDKNPVLSWAIGNAVVDIVDRNMNILLSKAKSVERIDPIAAVINAFVRAMTADNLDGYNSQGMRSF